MAADTFYIRANGLFFDLHNSRTGEVEVELIDCMAEALNYHAEYTAAAIDAETAEKAALADYYEEQRVLDHIYRAVSRIAAPVEPGDAKGEIRNRAVQMVLDAIDALGKPNSEIREAA